MKVCIVCDQLVVIVPPVDEVLTQSDQSVAYDIITTHLPHTHQAPALAHPPPHHHHRLSVPAVQALLDAHQLPHHQAPPSPRVEDET